MSPHITRSVGRATFAALSLVLLPVVASAQPGAGTPPTTSPDLSKDRTLYVVGYAHLDTQWRWAYPQVVREFIPNTMSLNFDLFNKYPDYIFNFSGSRRYEMMREYYPADYARVKQYVAQGKWFPCGSSVDEGDSIVPSGESMVRHMLYGNRFFREEFGKDSQEFMLPDCFGFPAALPTLLAHCGIKGFSTQKLTWGSANGIPFKVGNWIGPDGQQVIAALDPQAYTGSIREDLSNSNYWRDRINDTGQKAQVYADYHYYGAGDRGGAPGEDSVQMMERSVKGTGPLKVVSSTAEQMFRDITTDQQKRLPNYQGELLLTQHSAGSITSEAYMKRWNRKNELLADAAERASVAAMWLGGQPYPTKKLFDSWQLLLGSQMHDMLPGTSLPAAYEYCWNDELLALNGFAAAAQSGVSAIAAQLNTQTVGTPVVVYNPLAIARTDVVEATVPMSASAAGVQVIGPDGKAVTAQVLSRNGNYAKIAFVAAMPSIGTAVYDVRATPARSGNGELKVSARQIENARFRVTVNEAGDVSSIYDKRNNRETLASPIRLAFQYHNPGQFPAWNMDWNDQNKAPRGYVSGPATITIAENGPARVALQVVRETEGSRFAQTIRLSSGAAGDRVEFSNKIDWQSRECALKAVVQLREGNPLASYDGQLGIVKRGNNDSRKYEVPQHQWLDVTNTAGNYGVSILEDSKFGSDKPSDDTLRLTLIYTPGVRGGYQDQASQDTGRHDILFAIAPHAGTPETNGTVSSAARLNSPLMAFTSPKHAGASKTFSLARLNTTQASIGAIKKAEDGNEIVVRVTETTGKPLSSAQLSFAAPITKVRELDGQERPINSGQTMSLAGGKLNFSLKQFGIRAFAVTVQAPKAKLAAPQSQSVSLPFNADVISSDANRRDGRIDAQGHTLAAEQVPATIVSEGVTFKMGSTKNGAKNAVVARGQKINLPAGNWNRVYVLAAANGPDALRGDSTGTFTVGSRQTSQKVEGWKGFIGQWDVRQWNGEQPELTYDWPLAYTGLEPGFVKPGKVAWYSSHYHNPTSNEFYQYSYLFSYGFDVPAGAKTITLPNNPNIMVFGVSVARNAHDEARPAAPLYDTLSDHALDAPMIALNGQDNGSRLALNPLFTSIADTDAIAAANDARLVTITPALYGSIGTIRYTTDGSEPTLKSPLYQKPFYISRDTVVKARNFTLQGAPGPVKTMNFKVTDTTAPRVTSALGEAATPQLRLTFSEPVDAATATRTDAYSFSQRGIVPTTPPTVRTAVVDPDGMGVTLNLSAPLGELPTFVSIKGVSDLANPVNAIDANGAFPVKLAAPLYTLDAPQTFDGSGNGFRAQNAGVPTAGNAPWTINQWVYTDKQPGELSIIGGFGSGRDQSGAQRFLIKFKNSIHFWGANIDINSGVPFDLNRWQMITTTYDGQTLRIYKDGKEIKSQAVMSFSKAEPTVRIAPASAWDNGSKFSGRVANFTVWDRAVSPATIQTLLQQKPAA